MEELSFKILDKDDVNLMKLEDLRKDVYSIEEYTTNYYLSKILNGDMLVFVCFYQEKLVGGAYISNSLNSLFIEQLFVKKEYQNNKLHIGSCLLKYILKNKSYIEDYFHTKFQFSRLESRNQDYFYQEHGYQQEGNLLGTMKKRI